MIWPCEECRKRAYSSFRLADKVRRRSNRRNRAAHDEGMVYWCPSAGGWHVTSWARGDTDRPRPSTGARGITAQPWGRRNPSYTAWGQARRAVGNSPPGRR